MSYSNGLLSDQSHQTANKYVQRGLPGVGFKLTDTGDYDMQNKKLTNVKSGTDSNDAVNKSQLDATTNLLHGSRAGDVVNDKAVIYSNTGAVHARSLYLLDDPQDGNSNEVRLETPHQSYGNIHLNIPDLHNFDGFGGRPKSEVMVTSVEQTVTGKKVFENIEVHDPTSNNQAANKSYADTKLSLTGGTMTGNLDMGGKIITGVGDPTGPPADTDVVNVRSMMNMLRNLFPTDFGEKILAYLSGPRTANLDMGGHLVRKVGDPVNADDASTKNYVDNLSNTKLSLTGGTMTGDIILPKHNFPVPGNTNKVINYESQREIFLSRQESFPMQADINMNNNFIQNIATPMSSHQVTNKGYCDYNFLNRQSGGVLMGSLSMNQNDLFEIPAPKYGNSAVNKNYVDTEITKVHQNLDLTPFLRKDGQRAMTGSLNMNGNKIIRLKEPVSSSDASTKGYTDQQISNIPPTDTSPFLKIDGTRVMTGDLNMSTKKITNLGDPINDKDSINKQYLENKLIESHLQPSGHSNIFHFLMADKSKFTAIREIIIGSFHDIEKVAHTLNKKALSITLQNDIQTVSYSARLGLDMSSLPVGDYTLIMEFYWPEKYNIYTYADSTPTNIVDDQNIKNFNNYQKLYTTFTKKNTNNPNNLIMEIRGEISNSNPQTGYLIFYGTTGTHFSVTNDFYDQYVMSDMFVYNEDMLMKTDIDMNNNKIHNLSNGTDPSDVVNKQQLDSVNTNLETFKNQINTFKIYFKNYLYLSTFTSHFYDLKEPSSFILDGPAISGINPNMSIISSGSSHITVSGFDPIRGLQFNPSTKIIIDLGYMVNQNSPYTIMISLTLKDHFRLHFVEPIHEQTVYFPAFIYNPFDHTIRIQISNTVHAAKNYPVVFDNKQTMIWIYHDPSETKYEIIIGNGNYNNRILPPISNFSTNKLRIDANNNIINKICYQNQHFASAETFTKIMFEERKNGSYF